MAYVTRETFRGPIVMDEYACILVGLEAWSRKTTLDTLEMQHEALMPIVRVWTKKAARDAKLAERLEVALRKARRP
ncbi:MAG: hypothetical protein IPM54_24285 [Polyangiaceae bacterium]|nr:hypothetical protein [Polyangiaceae bacterium]